MPSTGSEVPEAASALDALAHVAPVGARSAGESRRPFLSVVVPTYNRGVELDRQLAWLHRELGALPVSWEVRVHDNCSTDATPEVLDRWLQAFGADRFHVVRNAHNIGGIPNLSQSLWSATGLWTWSIADDDRIHDGAAAEVVRILRAEPDLALLYLNYCDIDEAGEVIKPGYFDVRVSGRQEDGRAGYVHQCDHDLVSTILVTATVYRTALVRDAVAAWRGERDSWALMSFLTGYVAARGPIHVVPEVWIDCPWNVSWWQSRPGVWIKARYDDMPRAFLTLVGQGYRPDDCRRLGFRLLAEDGGWADLRSHLRALKWCPLAVVPLARLAVLGQRRSPERAPGAAVRTSPPART